MDTPFTTKAVILQALSEGPGYGSNMMGRVKVLTAERIGLHSGSGYPALVAMEGDGLIRRKKGKEIGRACFYYLTRKGRRLAEEQRELAKLIFYVMPDASMNDDKSTAA